MEAKKDGEKGLQLSKISGTPEAEYDSVELGSNGSRETEPNELDKPEDGGSKVEVLKSLSSCQAGLALLSAIVGGGIVGVPYAMFHTGIPLGIVLNILVAIAGWYTGTLYLRVKDLSPTYVESIYELGFVTIGVASIYFISLLILVSGIGCIMIYFIVFSDISASLAAQASSEDSFFANRNLYIILLGILMLPVCLKKFLNEMKCVSVFLFLSIAVFILLFLVQLCTLGEIENHDETFGTYYHVHMDMKLVTGFNIFVLAYAYHVNFWPTYNSLGANKNNKTAKRSVAIAAFLSLLIYVSLGILSIYTFGSDLKSSVLTNVDEEKNGFSYTIRVCFLLVLACHIPYIFHPTKESFLIIFDEAQNSSMQKSLELKMKQREGQTERGEAKQMAYLSMTWWKYYLLTTLLYFACIIGAITVENIAVVFEFVGAFGLSITSFTLPGIMYLLMIRNPNAKHEIETKSERRCNKIGAVGAICLSVFNMLLVFGKQFYEDPEAAQSVEQ